MIARNQTVQIWKEAVHFAEHVYDVSRAFPRFEIFNLRQDLTRAASSISLSIIRGANAPSQEDCRKVIWTTFNHLDEVIMFLNIAQKQNYISQDVYDEIYAECEKLSKTLSDLTHDLTPKIPSLN